MKKLTMAERQSQIINLLSEHGAMKMIDLAKHFNVSRETIRRDLIAMNQEGSVQKWFGGVISTKEKQDFNVRSLDQKMELNSDIKMKIAEKALEFIPPRADIYLGDGSTVLCLAKLLSTLSDYTIITSSLEVVNLCLKSSNKLIVCGGVINPIIKSTVGAPTVDFLRNLKTDVAFIGSSGFKLNDGPTGNDFESCQVKKIVIKNTQSSIILSDSTKASYSSLITFANWKDIRYLITDSQIDSAVHSKIAAATHVILADH